MQNPLHMLANQKIAQTHSPLAYVEKIPEGKSSFLKMVLSSKRNESKLCLEVESSHETGMSFVTHYSPINQETQSSPSHSLYTSIPSEESISSYFLISIPPDSGMHFPTLTKESEREKDRQTVLAL